MSKMIFSRCIVAVVLCIMIASCGDETSRSRSFLDSDDSSGSSGSITFAEKFNPETLEAEDEGTIFSTGQVYIIVRSPKPFDCTPINIFYNDQSSDEWSQLESLNVEREWNVTATVIELCDPGTYTLQARATDGHVIAENEVTIQ